MTTKKCIGCDYHDLNCDDALCSMCDHEPELIVENMSTYDYIETVSADEAMPFLVL